MTLKLVGILGREVTLRIKALGEYEIPKGEGSREKNYCLRRSSRHKVGIWVCGEMRCRR